MRRAQSVRHYARPSLAHATDDLGVLREDESSEDALRRQLLDKDRENDRLQTQVQILQAQLAQRPPIEAIQDLEKEYKNLDLLLQGTQRENERCMAELERGKTREKMLERELAKLAGENWQSALDIAPVSSIINRSTILHTRSNTLATPPPRPSTTTNEPPNQATLAHVEQIRLLILGMEKRLQGREDKLVKTIERAEGETTRFEELRKEVLTSGS